MLAVAFVAGPFYVRTAIAAFEAVDPTLVAASRTLGAGPGRTFGRVALPLAAGGLGAGAALSFARGIGEFGATIMFAGSLQGVTQTLSLAVYEQFDVDFDTALAIGAVLVRRERRPASHRQARPRMATLSVDFSHPLRAFALDARARASRRETLALVGPSGRRQVERPAGGRRACCGRRRAGSRSTARRGSTRRAASTSRRSVVASGCSSRTTRSSRI